MKDTSNCAICWGEVCYFSKWSDERFLPHWW